MLNKKPLRDETEPRKDAQKAGAMEFDFGIKARPAPLREDKTSTSPAPLFRTSTATQQDKPTLAETPIPIKVRLPSPHSPVSFSKTDNPTDSPIRVKTIEKSTYQKPVAALDASLSSPSNSKSSTLKPAGIEPAKTEKSAPMPTATPIIDYRKNVERQIREQRATTSILNTVAYVLIGLFVFFGALAGYGAYVIFNELKAQKVTTAAIREEMKGSIQALQKELQESNETLSQVREENAQLTAALGARIDSAQATINVERKTRDAETSDLKNRVGQLEKRAAKLEKKTP